MHHESQSPLSLKRKTDQNVDGSVRPGNSAGLTFWKTIACVAFLMLTFNTLCFLMMSVAIIDVLNLWCDLPVVRDVILALGFGC